MVTQTKKSDNTSGKAASNQKMFNNQKTTNKMKKFNLKKTVALAVIATAGFTTNVKAQGWIGGGGVLYSHPPTSSNVGVGTTNPNAKFEVDESSGGATSATAIIGFADNGSIDNFGVYGETGGTPGSNVNAGVYGKIGSSQASALANTAIYGDANNLSGTNDWAGYFNGNVFRSGTDNFTSDEKLKENIKPIVSSLDKIKLLKPSMYNFKRNEFKALNLPNGQQFGLVAQDLEKVFPELIQEMSLPERDENGKIFYTGKTFKTVQYIGLIPITIAALQEEHKTVESLKHQVAELQAIIASMQQKQVALPTGIEELNANNAFSMEQNVPNPFTGETLIHFNNLPQSANNVYLSVCDLSGKQLLNVPVNERGSASVTFNAKDLAAGIYLYSIIADGKILDSKRMIVEK